MIEDLARVRRLQQIDAAQQRRFAGAGGADDARRLALVRREIDAAQHLMAAERLVQAANLDHTFHDFVASFSFSTETTISARLSLWEPWMT